MKKHNKIKLAVVISVISVLIAIISLMFSVYMNMKEIEYKEYAKQMEQISQELQKRGLEFDESYKKVGLAEKSIMEQIENCNRNTNENELNKNLKLLINARSALIKNDYVLASAYLDQVNVDNICEGEVVVKDNTLYWEIGILVIIWVVLIFSLIKVERRKNRRKN